MTEGQAHVNRAPLPLAFPGMALILFGWAAARPYHARAGSPRCGAPSANVPGETFVGFKASRRKKRSGQRSSACSRGRSMAIAAVQIALLSNRALQATYGDRLA